MTRNRKRPTKLFFISWAFLLDILLGDGIRSEASERLKTGQMKITSIVAETIEKSLSHRSLTNALVSVTRLTVCRG